MRTTKYGNFLREEISKLAYICRVSRLDHQLLRLKKVIARHFFLPQPLHIKRDTYKAWVGRCSRCHYPTVFTVGVRELLRSVPKKAVGSLPLTYRLLPHSESTFINFMAK